MSWAKHAAEELIPEAHQPMVKQADEDSRRFWRNVLLAGGGLAALGGGAYLANKYSPQLKDWLTTVGKTDKEKALQLEKNKIQSSTETAKLKSDEVKAEQDRLKDYADNTRTLEAERNGTQTSKGIKDFVLASNGTADTARLALGGVGGYQAGGALQKGFLKDQLLQQAQSGNAAAIAQLEHDIAAATAPGSNVSRADLKLMTGSLDDLRNAGTRIPNLAQNLGRTSIPTPAAGVVGQSLSTMKQVGRNLGGKVIGGMSGLLAGHLMNSYAADRAITPAPLRD